MTPDKEVRKLAAIMHADVKGYSRLMGEDESYTVRVLEEFRQLFAENIRSHEGGSSTPLVTPFWPSFPVLFPRFSALRKFRISSRLETQICQTTVKWYFASALTWEM